MVNQGSTLVDKGQNLRHVSKDHPLVKHCHCVINGLLCCISSVANLLVAVIATDFEENLKLFGREKFRRRPGMIGNVTDVSDDIMVTSAWMEVTGDNQQVFAFNGSVGSNPNLDTTTNILQIMVTETNLNAQQVLTKAGKSERVANWKPGDMPYTRQFLGILLYVGLVSYPKIESYWSTSPIYKNNGILGNKAKEQVPVSLAISAFF